MQWKNYSALVHFWNPGSKEFHCSLVSVITNSKENHRSYESSFPQVFVVQSKETGEQS